MSFCLTLLKLRRSSCSPTPSTMILLRSTQEEDLKKWLDKALYMLTDLSFVANMHGEAGIDSLATSIQNYMIAMKHVMFPEPEEDGI